MLPKIFSYSNFINVCMCILLANNAESARGKGDCILIDENDNKVSSYEWEYGIKLKPINDFEKLNTEIIRYKTNNTFYVTNYKTSSNQQNNYFDAEVLESSTKELIITTGQYFHSYENYETSSEIDLIVTFYCHNYEYSTMTFHISIKDTNNHDPEFLHGPYKFTLSMPVPKGFDLDLNKQLAVRDVDLTNNQITFNLEQNKITNKFLISSIGQDTADKKNYLTKFVTSTALDLEQDLTFKLSATDSGIPSRTANTTITIVVDKANSSPKFSSLIYTADLTKMNYGNDNRFILPFSEGNITLIRGYHQGLEKLEIEGISEENKEHFKLTQSGALSDNGLVVYVELIELTQEFLSQKFLTVVLKAVKNGLEASAILQILMPDTSFEDTSTIENVTCSTNIEESSIDGYMVATVILSLVSLGLLGYIIFSYLNRA